jgi:hypothetical protein
MRYYETGENTKATSIRSPWADVMTEAPRLKNKDVVSSRWLFKIKHAADGSIEKYKARFVTRGFSQKEGIDYEETFAPVARYTSIRTIIALAAKMKWKLHQMDQMVLSKRKCI